jgi:SlyX protein
MTTDERLVDVEIRIARQEDLIDVLNKTVYEQQKKIDELEALCTALARHVKDLRDAASDVASDALALEKPPHY